MKVLIHIQISDFSVETFTILTILFFIFHLVDIE